MIIKRGRVHGNGENEENIIRWWLRQSKKVFYDRNAIEIPLDRALVILYQVKMLTIPSKWVAQMDPLIMKHNSTKRARKDWVRGVTPSKNY